MRYLFSLSFIFLISIVHAQNDSLSNDLTRYLDINTCFPNFLRAGDHIELTSIITNHSGKEWTGQVQLEMVDKQKVPVDGWFMNTFPNQYFTVEANGSHKANFPIQVPFDYEGKIIVKLSVLSGNRHALLKDSLIIIAPDSVKRNQSASLIRIDKKLFAVNKTEAKPRKKINAPVAIKVSDTIYAQIILKVFTSIKQLQIMDPVPSGTKPIASSLNRSMPFTIKTEEQLGHLIFSARSVKKGTYTLTYKLLAKYAGTFYTGNISVYDGDKKTGQQQGAELTIE